MNNNGETRENFSFSESHEQPYFFEPITKERLDELVLNFSREHQIDLSRFTIAVARPGDPSFDILEVLTKVQGKFIPEEVVPRLKDRGVDLSKPFPRTLENAEKMREVARAEGMELDGVLKGFVYNTAGNITYTAIRSDQIQNLASVYSKKEGEERIFEDIDEAKEYIKKLAEKYLIHEIGHTVFRKFVTDSGDRQAWFTAVRENEGLVQEIFELQREKYPNTPIENLMPIIYEEAFAEIFSSISTNGRVKGRVSSYPSGEALMKDTLEKYGFKL